MLSALLYSCSFEQKAPPIGITSLKAEVGNNEYHKLLGLKFYMANTGETAISKATFSFSMWDSEKNPFPKAGQNCLEISLAIDLDANDAGDIYASLDKFVTYAPSGSLIIKDFMPTTLTFEDGSTWTNTYRMYVYPSVNETVVVSE